MLRGLIICPDAEMAKRLEEALHEANQNVAVIKTLDRYPSGLELMRFVRAHAPQMIFLSTESLPKAMEVVGTLEQESVGLPLVAISRTCEPEVLLDLMRMGIREFLSMPFQRQTVFEALARVEDQVQKKPPTIESSDALFSFLPSKQGVGTSTIALNAAVALSRHEKPASVLHIDLDLTSGIVGFMLKLTNTRSVVEAAENWQSLDESLWPQLVTRNGKLDVLPSGRLEPEFRIEGAQLRHIIEFARRTAAAR
jgi:pilus assembly protein CpaE